MLIDGQVENCIAIIDIDCSNMELCLIDYFQQIFNLIHYFFKAFFFKIIVLNSKNIEINCQKNILKSISEIYANEIEFFPDINISKLLEYISKNQLLSQYGGQAEIEDYWYLFNRPPDIPNLIFEENPRKILNIEEYKKRLKENEFMIPRPDFASKIRKHRKNKKGLILHKEIIFETCLERRNSYNEIYEKVVKEKNGNFQELIINENPNVLYEQNSSSLNNSEIFRENIAKLEEFCNYIHMGDYLKSLQGNNCIINKNEEITSIGGAVENQFKTDLLPKVIEDRTFSDKFPQKIHETDSLNSNNSGHRNSLCIKDMPHNIDTINLKPKSKDSLNKFNTLPIRNILKSEKNQVENILESSILIHKNDNNQVTFSYQEEEKKSKQIYFRKFESKDFFEGIKEKTIKNLNTDFPNPNYNNKEHLPNIAQDNSVQSKIKGEKVGNNYVKKYERIRNTEFINDNNDLNKLQKNIRKYNIYTQIEMKTEQDLSKIGLNLNTKFVTNNPPCEKEESKTINLNQENEKNIQKLNSKWYFIGDCC